MQADLIDNSEKSQYNQFFDGENKSLGIITCGIAYTYLMDNFLEVNIKYPVLKINQYPIPESKIRQLFDTCDKILILEEGYPVVEEYLRDNLYSEKNKVVGRLTGNIPRTGELNSDIIAKAFGLS